MTETTWVIIFVVTVYGGFYYLAHRAEKELKRKAKTIYGDKSGAVMAEQGLEKKKTPSRGR